MLKCLYDIASLRPGSQTQGKICINTKQKKEKERKETKTPKKTPNKAKSL